MKEKERYEVLFEEVKGMFDVLAEGQNVLVAKVDKIDDDIVEMKEDIVEMKEDIVEMNDRLNRVEDHLENVDGRLRQVEHNTRDLQAIREKQIEQDKRFSQHEKLNVQYKLAA
jgi:chromosome segregation ATPase